MISTRTMLRFSAPRVGVPRGKVATVGASVRRVHRMRETPRRRAAPPKTPRSLPAAATRRVHGKPETPRRLDFFLWSSAVSPRKLVLRIASLGDALGLPLIRRHAYTIRFGPSPRRLYGSRAARASACACRKRSRETRRRSLLPRSRIDEATTSTSKVRMKRGEQTSTITGLTKQEKPFKSPTGSPPRPVPSGTPR